MLNDDNTNYDYWGNFFQELYDQELGSMDTFSEQVGQQIRDELLRCCAEAREYYRRKAEANNAATEPHGE